jgi:hypothetical protein
MAGMKVEMARRPAVVFTVVATRSMSPLGVHALEHRRHAVGDAAHLVDERRRRGGVGHLAEPGASPQEHPRQRDRDDTLVELVARLPGHGRAGLEPVAAEAGEDVVGHAQLQLELAVELGGGHPGLIDDVPGGAGDGLVGQLGHGAGRRLQGLLVSPDREPDERRHGQRDRDDAQQPEACP